MNAIKGAGILLIENYNNNQYITLFGNKGGKYEDLGGISEYGDLPEETAYMEGREESCNTVNITPAYLVKYGHIVDIMAYRCYVMYITNLSYRDYLKNAYQVHTQCSKSSWKESNDMTRIPIANILYMIQQGHHSVQDIFGKQVIIRDRTIHILKMGHTVILNLLTTAPHVLIKNITIRSRMKCLIGTISYSLQTYTLANAPYGYIQYAIYVVPNSKTLNYYGINILLAGFHPNNNKANILKHISNSGSINWHVNKHAIQLYTNTLTINSTTLHNIAIYMANHGFTNVNFNFAINIKNINLINNIIYSTWQIVLVERQNGVQRIIAHYPLKTN